MKQTTLCFEVDNICINCHHLGFGDQIDNDDLCCKLTSNIVNDNDTCSKFVPDMSRYEDEAYWAKNLRVSK